MVNRSELTSNRLITKQKDGFWTNNRLLTSSMQMKYQDQRSDIFSEKFKSKITGSKRLHTGTLETNAKKFVTNSNFKLSSDLSKSIAQTISSKYENISLSSAVESPTCALSICSTKTNDRPREVSKSFEDFPAYPDLKFETYEAATKKGIFKNVDSEKNQSIKSLLIEKVLKNDCIFYFRRK